MAGTPEGALKLTVGKSGPKFALIENIDPSGLNEEADDDDASSDIDDDDADDDADDNDDV
jgi:hypothetical protein